MKRISDYFHKINVFIMVILFIYSIIYFLYYQFSLKTNLENPTNNQEIFYTSYWIIMFFYLLLYIIMHIIYITMGVRRKKRIKKNKKHDDFFVYSKWLLVSIFSSIFLYSIISFLLLVFYDLIGEIGIGLVNSTINFIKYSPIILFWSLFVLSDMEDKKNIFNDINN